MQGISWLTEELLASQEGLCSKNLVILRVFLTAPRKEYVLSLCYVKIFLPTFVLKHLHLMFFHWTVGKHFRAKQNGYIYTYNPQILKWKVASNSYICSLHLEPLVYT
jgi:hypothetical protein